MTSLNAQRHTIEYHQADKETVERYQNEVDALAGLVIELLETNPTSVLSPIIRTLSVEKARKVQAYRAALLNRLFVDNPGDRPIEVKLLP